MFDVGFWELAIIAVVALLVIGPERLPGVARTAGLWFGKMRGFVTSVKADIDKELQADELKKMLDRQAQSTGLHDIFEETEDALSEVKKQEYLVRSIDNDFQQELDNMSGAVEEEDPVTTAAKASPGRAFDHHKSAAPATAETTNGPQSEPAAAPAPDDVEPKQPENEHVAKPKD